MLNNKLGDSYSQVDYKENEKSMFGISHKLYIDGNAMYNHNTLPMIYGDHSNDYDERESVLLDTTSNVIDKYNGRWRKEKPYWYYWLEKKPQYYFNDNVNYYYYDDNNKKVINTMMLPVNKTLLPREYITMLPDNNIEHMNGSVYGISSYYLILVLTIMAIIIYYIIHK
jgi:hypothetical protein